MTKMGKHGMVDPAVSLKPHQEAAPLTPRTAGGRCGTCDGHLSYDVDLEADKCRTCSRLAGPALRTPEQVRAEVLAELTTMAVGLDHVTFWSTFVLVNTVAEIVGMNSKMFRQWTRLNKFEIVVKRNPSTGKRADFLTVDTAKAVIRFRM